MSPIRSLILAICFLAPTSRAEPFPEAGLLPKDTTGAVAFLKEHPNADGRGVIIAVFDSGVDPAAAGLRSTSEGKPKIIDIIDATGSGDVSMTHTVEAKEGTVAALSGKVLRLPSTWPAPRDGHYRLGIKAGYELFPSALVGRLRKERLEAWSQKQENLVASLVNQAANAKDDAREDLQAQLDSLRSMMDHYADPGPVYDCLLFHDGTEWRAAIDTDGDADLADETLLAPYKVNHQFATFSDESMQHFAVNVYDDGERLSILTESSAHGTHVAGIIAGHHPNEPELNGLAPGAQVVSIKIGDNRLDAMETGSALMRALRAAIDEGCHLINMSYGEATRLPNEGRLIEQINETVREHNIIFVASAGNEGPALGTVGAPGGTTTSTISVAAAVTPDMARAGYALNQNFSPLAYTWSSRGPTADGALGVSIAAPGGAFASVPEWSLDFHEWMNGTSMASPNACGNLALLLSALHQEKHPYSAEWVRRAIETTAQEMPSTSPFGQGHGMLRIDRAYEWTLANPFVDGPAAIDVSLPSRHGARGLYLREPAEDTLTESVSVKPRFSKRSLNTLKTAWHDRISLKSTASWLHTPEHLFLSNSAQTFNITVRKGQCFETIAYGEIQGFSESNPKGGPVFRLPVTLIKSDVSPSAPIAALDETYSLTPGTIQRKFLLPPSDSTWAEISLTAHETGSHPFVFVLHASQVIPQRRHEETSQRFRLTLTEGITETRRFPVKEGHTLEVALASYWSNQSTGQVQVNVRFHGLSPTPNQITISPSAPIARVDIRSPSLSKLSPTARLTTWRQAIAPEQAFVRGLDQARDLTPEGSPTTALTLDYAFTLTEDATITPRLTALNEQLYEGDTQSQLWMLFDENKQRLITDDGWEPSPVPLRKGRYYLRYHLRHTDAEALEKWKATPLALDITLKAPITLSIAATQRTAALGQSESFGQRLRKDESTPIHITAPEEKSLPSGVSSGDLLLGEFRLNGDDPNHGLIVYTVQRTAKKTAPGASDVNESLDDALMAIKAKYLTKTTDDDAFARLATTLREAHPNAIPLLTVILDRTDQVTTRKQDHMRIVNLCDDILRNIDQDALAKYRGHRHLEENDEERAYNAIQEKNFGILTDTLYRKCRAIAYHDGIREDAGEPFDPKPFDDAYKQLQGWVDTTEAPYILAWIRDQRRHHRFGLALKKLNEHMEDRAPTRLLHDKRIKILKKLGWDFWAEHEETWNLRRFQDDYPLF